jgi:hypothetical protein
MTYEIYSQTTARIMATNLTDAEAHQMLTRLNGARFGGKPLHWSKAYKARPVQHNLAAMQTVGAA